MPPPPSPGRRGGKKNYVGRPRDRVRELPSRTSRPGSASDGGEPARRARGATGRWRAGAGWLTSDGSGAEDSRCLHVASHDDRSYLDAVTHEPRGARDVQLAQLIETGTVPTLERRLSAPTD